MYINSLEQKIIGVYLIVCGRTFLNMFDCDNLFYTVKSNSTRGQLVASH